MIGKAIGYARVSTTRQGNDGISLDMQEERIKAYCVYKGYSFQGMFTEVITGSGKEDRPAFNDALSRLECGNANVIVVYSLSRFTRSTKELLDFVDKYVLNGSVELHSVVENLDTSSPTGRFMLKVMGAMNELEREQIVQRTQAALDHKRAKGEKLGGYIPYGFDLDGKNLIVNTHEQHEIAWMKQQFDTGHSLNWIAGELNSQSIPTKQGKSWDHKTISRILRRV